MTAAQRADSGPERRTGTEVVEQLRLLWPAPAQVELSGRRQVSAARAASADRKVLEFIPLPRAAHPRILVPSTPGAVAAGALRRSRVSTGLGARLRTTAAVTAARTGLLALHPDRVVIRRTAPRDATEVEVAPLLDRLREVLGEVTPAFYIGPVRAVQKPVIQLLDRRGRTIAFAKVGINEFTNSLVASEAASLQRVGAHQWNTMRVPNLLLHEQWNGHELLVQEALPDDGAPTPQQVAAASAEIAALETPRAQTLGQTSWWHDVVRRVAALDTAASSATSDAPTGSDPSGSIAALASLVAAVRDLDARAAEVSVTLGCAHLDWAPWNMARAGRALGVWDWEQFASGIPLGYDAVHYAVQDAVVLAQEHPREVFAAVRRRAPELLGPLGLDPLQADQTVLLYVLDLATRYQRDRESGTRLSRLHTWLAPTMDSFAHDPAGHAP